jgi:hypothetical protein
MSPISPYPTTLYCNYFHLLAFRDLRANRFQYVNKSPFWGKTPNVTTFFLFLPFMLRACVASQNPVKVNAVKQALTGEL